MLGGKRDVTAKNSLDRFSVLLLRKSGFAKFGGFSGHFSLEKQKTKFSNSPFSARRFQRKLLFSCGANPSRPLPKTKPLQVPLPLRKEVVPRKRGVLEEEDCMRRSGVDRKCAKAQKVCQFSNGQSGIYWRGHPCRASR